MNKGKEIFLTSEGFLALETELKDLQLVKKPQIMKELKEARALGDLSENAEYSQAKADQEQLEKRIADIEYKLENATIVENKNKDQVGIGSIVQVMYDGEDDVEEYKIVGSAEADPMNNKISNESPLAMALMNKKVGELVQVTSPDGLYGVKIVKIA